MRLECMVCGCRLDDVPPYGGYNGAFDRATVYGLCPDHEEKKPQPLIKDTIVYIGEKWED